MLNPNILTPLLCYAYRSRPPKRGVAMVEIINTNTSTHTTIEGLPVAYTTLSVSDMPANDPKSDQLAIQMAYGMFK